MQNTTVMPGSYDSVWVPSLQQDVDPMLVPCVAEPTPDLSTEALTCLLERLRGNPVVRYSFHQRTITPSECECCWLVRVVIPVRRWRVTFEAKLRQARTDGIRVADVTPEQVVPFTPSIAATLTFSPNASGERSYIKCLNEADAATAVRRLLGS